MNLHEQARAEAEKWLGDYHGSIDATALVLAWLAGHEAATRTRVVTTVTELDALPVGSVVLAADGFVFWREAATHWAEAGYTWRPTSEHIALPARVLYEPEETR